MPGSLTISLFQGATQNIQHEILKHKSHAPLLVPYHFTYENLEIEVWHERLDRDLVTYGMVANFITGLKKHLSQIGNVECKVDLYKVQEGMATLAGVGILAYRTNVAALSQSINPTISNATNTNPLTHPIASSQRANATQRVGPYTYRVPNTQTLITIVPDDSAATMPEAETLELWDEVGDDVSDELETHSRTATLDDGSYFYGPEDVAFEATETLGPLTYARLLDVVQGLKDSFAHVHYLESVVTIYDAAPAVPAVLGYVILTSFAGEVSSSR